jgi:hypothetical protein
MKKLTFILTVTLSSTLAWSSPSIKPGLWEIKTKMVGPKGEIDPSARMREAMAKMPAEQRKQMEAMMSKQEMPLSGDGMKICYTAEQLKDYGAFKNTKGPRKCTSKVTKQSSQVIHTEFNCPDGSKGTGTWNIGSDTQYSGKMDITTAKGEKVSMSHAAKFLGANCGSIKPLPN